MKTFNEVVNEDTNITENFNVPAMNVMKLINNLSSAESQTRKKSSLNKQISSTLGKSYTKNLLDINKKLNSMIDELHEIRDEIFNKE